MDGLICYWFMFASLLGLRGDGREFDLGFFIFDWA